ncbi:alginate lyase family protein [Maribacter polysiphoniae]|uniref:Alginate lyase n=1 Tax=Maribacter polysiphoniae TaxID=429344 RepID=A0A316E9L5_9FLAO|nr:alginate lyase family protein [Maribacter polysiphoniae]MBD1262379.1 alginate lyase family protein [Maribacter polysiphoniae]PWK26079.1 alginate lyase [Maribacter polysiphoniae]
MRFIAYLLRRVLVLCCLITFLVGAEGFSQEHPNLILTKAGVEKIRAELGGIPIFDATLKQVKEEVDAEIAMGIHTPIPKDYSGGYTHERHKRNFIILQKAGVLFQILEDEKYAVYVRDMLFQYEAMYKDLPVHPKERSYARGKLFWQCLNDSNWLVYVSQAYDCVYDWFSKKERKKLEKNLFRPFADFISVGNPQFYNRVHNHSTWGNAAVGMIGLVMNDDELIERALYGIKDVKLDVNAKDNDGGFIQSKDKKAGFLANLDEPFSPDGYYTEGPYYQRYAMYPFLIFAEGLQNVRPELNIFAHKDSVLLKSVNALLNLSDKDGEFFPLNDGQKGMSYYSRELVTAVDIAYHFGGYNAELLSVAEKQDRVVLDDSGLSVALGLKENKAKPFPKKSILLSDGPEGNEGGVGIIRYGNEELSLVFKYAAQGLSHGHYDKLSFSLYDEGDEVLQDYGLARFVNIEQKGGGNYLKENKTWAKQTVAHNTVVQNMTSHFKGKYEIGSEHHSELFFSDISDPDFQVISAKEVNAYPGTSMHRTMAMIKDTDFERPFVLDVFKITSDSENQYDLPFYFMGQVMKTNFEYDTPTSLQAMGGDNGYQHLWLEGKGKPSGDNTKLSWLNQGHFYTLTTTADSSDELLFTRLGASDPEFNLRRDAAFMVRRKARNTVFVSVVEPHGHYSAVSEFAVNSNSSIAHLGLIYDDENYTGVAIEDKEGNTLIFIQSNTNGSSKAQHRLKIKDKEYQWTGPYYFKQ